MLAVLREFLADPSRPKIVHDPKILDLLAGPVHGVSDSIMLYSFLLRPTTAQHDLPSVVLRHLNSTLAGTLGEHADYLQRLAPLLRAEVVPRGWVSDDTFLAGYGAAQALPGPLFTFSAYLGTVMHPGAWAWARGLLCLFAIFLPAWLLLIRRASRIPIRSIP